MNLIQTLEQEEIARLNKEIPAFAPGDTVIVSVNVVEGTRKRLQAYEGVVVARRNRGLGHGTTQCYYLFDQVAFANPADGRVATHLAQGFNIVG